MAMYTLHPGGSSTPSSSGSSNSGNWFTDFLSRIGHSAAVAGQATASPYQATPVTAPVTNPPSSVSPVGGSSAVTSDSDHSLDPSGTDQAQWEYERQKELLEMQREYNSAEAAKNRAWQEYMSNTAIQRQVKDLEAAGLNKWLALNGGSAGGASTPSGSAATSSAGDASAPNPRIYLAMLEYMKAIMTSAIKIIDFF